VRLSQRKKEERDGDRKGRKEGRREGGRKEEVFSGPLPIFNKVI
jgi:hypothetical protein